MVPEDAPRRSLAQGRATGGVGDGEQDGPLVGRHVQRIGVAGRHGPQRRQCSGPVPGIEHEIVTREAHSKACCAERPLHGLPVLRDERLHRLLPERHRHPPAAGHQNQSPVGPCFQQGPHAPGGACTTRRAQERPDRSTHRRSGHTPSAARVLPDIGGGRRSDSVRDIARRSAARG